MAVNTKTKDRAYLELKKLVTEKATLAELRELIQDQMLRLKHEHAYAIEALNSVLALEQAEGNAASTSQDPTAVALESSTNLSSMDFEPDI